MTARALVVAVPTAPASLGLPTLPGAERDASRMASLLTGRGFEVTPLTGASLAQFVAALIALRAATGEGDLALVYFAGHGYRLPDTQGDEKDGRDECLVLSDLLLPDDWFRESFWPFTREGSWWVTCVDTCFSATAMMSLDRLDEDDIDESLTRPMRVLPPPHGEARIWLAAAGEDRSALEIGQGKAAYGWYTRQLLDLLADDPDLSYRALWTRLQKRWLADTATRFRTLAQPRMAMTDPAQPLADQRAFAALTIGVP